MRHSRDSETPQKKSFTSALFDFTSKTTGLLLSFIQWRNFVRNLGGGEKVGANFPKLSEKQKMSYIVP